MGVDAWKRTIADMPRVYFVWFERDVIYYGRVVGIMWGRNLDAQEGELIYRHKFMIRFMFHFSIERA